MQNRSRKPHYYERDKQRRGDQYEGRRGRGFIATDILPSATDYYCPYEATTQSDTEAEEERAFWKRDRWQRQQMQQIQQQQKKRGCGKGGGIYRRGSLLVTAPTPSEYRQMMVMRQNEAPFHDFPTAFGGGIHHRQNQQQHQFHRFLPLYPNPHSNNHNQQQKNKKKGGEKQTMPWLQQPPPHLWCSTPKSSPSSTSPESSSHSSFEADSEDEVQDENNISQTTDGGGEEAGKSPESSIPSETINKKMDHHLSEFAGKVGGENIEKALLEKEEDDKENSFNGNDEDDDDDGGSVYFRPTTSKALGPLMNLNLLNNGNIMGKKTTAGGGRKKQKQQQNRRPRPFHKQHQAMVENPPPSGLQNPYGYGGQTTKFTAHPTFLQQPTPYFGYGGGYDFLDPPLAAFLQQHNHQQQHHQVQQQHLKHSKLPNRQHRRSIRHLLLPPFDKAPAESTVNAIDAAIVSAPIVLDHRDHRLLTEQQQKQKRQREQQFFFFHNSSPVGAPIGTSRRNRTEENDKDCLDVTYKNLIDLKLADETPAKNDEKEKNTGENNGILTTKIPSGAEAITAITPSSTRSPDPQEFQCRLTAMAEEEGGESSSNKERDAAEETHFVNYEEENEIDLSREKPHYENILQPQRPAPQWLMPTAPGAVFHNSVQAIEDGPEVYGRLVALSLLECAGPCQSESVRRGVYVARRQIEELLGIDPKHTESLCLDPAAVAGGEEKNQRAAEFAHSCALFGSLVAAHLRSAQALDDALGEGGRLSGRQHNGRLHRLHRILDRLKRGELVAARVGTDQKSGPFGAALLGKLRASGGRHSRLRTLWRRVTARIF